MHVPHVSGAHVGQRITRLREARGWSQTDLANRVWPGRQKPRYRTVHRWETEGVVPSTPLLRRLAEVFGVTIEELLGVASGQEPPFAAWKAFTESARGQRMTEEQRRTLAGIPWIGMEPTVEAYAVLLSGLELARPS